MDFPRNGGHSAASRGGAFKRFRTDPAKMAVASIAIVEDLDVVDDIGTRKVTGVMSVNQA